MKRRIFLGTTAVIALSAKAGLTAALAAPVAIGAGGAKGPHALADHLLLSHPHRASLEAIGEVYRQDGADPIAACSACLPDALQSFLRHLDLSEADLREMSPVAIRSAVRTRTAQDFAEDRTVSIRGWLLGETEARLCAIAALRAA